MRRCGRIFGAYIAFVVLSWSCNAVVQDTDAYPTTQSMAGSKSATRRVSRLRRELEADEVGSDDKKRGSRKESRRTRKVQSEERKDCQQFFKSQQDPYLERLILPVEHYRYENQNPSTAYQMAYVSLLSYWDFHKHQRLPERCQQFHLERSLPRWQVYDDIRHNFCRFSASVKDALLQSNAALANFNQTHSKNTGDSCRRNQTVLGDKKMYRLHYYFYDWHELGVAGIKFHDTDLLILTSDDDKELIIAFAGTASGGDAVTNIQTFEPANHSSFFVGAENKPIQGSLHRGFLNAYSRVDHGSVLRLSNRTMSKPIQKSMRLALRKCKRPVPKKKKNPRKTNKQSLPSNDKGDEICAVQGTKLVEILRRVVIPALKSGTKVHVTGHSLGGGLATLFAGDLLINFPEVPVRNLHLWTFGAPQVADTLFLQSAFQAVPRLKSFFLNRGYGRCHRFVTLSDTCKVDMVSEVAKSTLAAHKTNFHGRFGRRVGGVHGHVAHFAEPHYLLTPTQIEATHNTSELKTGTHSTVAAHSMDNYLQGISRESSGHPLSVTMPLTLEECLVDV